MNSKNNGKLLLFMSLELKLMTSGRKVIKLSVNTVVSISWSQQTLWRLYLLLISSKKEFGEAEWNDLNNNGARVEELASWSLEKAVGLRSYRARISVLRHPLQEGSAEGTASQFYLFLNDSMTKVCGSLKHQIFSVSQISLGSSPFARCWGSAL